jgi:hypothetical protein
MTETRQTHNPHIGYDGTASEVPWPTSTPNLGRPLVHLVSPDTWERLCCGGRASGIQSTTTYPPYATCPGRRARANQIMAAVLLGHDVAMLRYAAAILTQRGYPGIAGHVAGVIRALEAPHG